MDREKQAFLNTVPFTANQRAYVEACWEEKPEKNGALSPFERVCYFFSLYLFDLFLLLCLVAWPHPLGVIVSLVVAWFLALVGMFGQAVIIEEIKKSVAGLGYYWNTLTAEDELMTQRWFLRRFVSPQPVWREPVVIMLSAVGCTALFISRHWITFVAYVVSCIASIVFYHVVIPRVKNYLAARARAYARHFNLPADPATDPNPGHPRPVIL